MSLLHLTFRPELLAWFADAIFETINFPTGKDEMDAMVQEYITSDKIQFKDAYQNDQWEAYQYTFDLADNLIHLWVRNPSGDVQPNILKDALEEYNPGETDRDITILDGEVAKQWGYDMVKLKPKLSQVWLLIPAGNGEYDQHQVDLARL